MEAQINPEGILVVKPTTETEGFGLAAWALGEHKVGLLTADDNILLIDDKTPTPPTEDEVVAGLVNPKPDAIETAINTPAEKDSLKDAAAVGSKMTKAEVIAKLDQMPAMKGKYSSRTSVGKLNELYISATMPDQGTADIAGPSAIPESEVAEEEKDYSHTELCGVFREFLESLKIEEQPACEAEGMKLLKRFKVKKLGDLIGDNRKAFIKEVIQLTCQNLM